MSSSISSIRSPVQEDFTFTGTSTQECERFIRQVKVHARAQGKLRDNDWVVDYVESCLEGKALRWYLKQSKDVREDWTLLQTALLENWDEGEGGYGAPSTIPGGGAPAPAAAPAAPPPRGIDDLIAKFGSMNLKELTGRLKIVSQNPLVGQYVSRLFYQSFGNLEATDDRNNALIVKYRTSSKPGMLEILNSPDTERWLGITFYEKERINSNTDSFGALAVTSNTGVGTGKTPLTSYTRGEGSTLSDIWYISPFDGEVIPRCKLSGMTFEMDVVIRMPENRVFLTLNFDAHCASFRKHHSYSIATLVFEPIS